MKRIVCWFLLVLMLVGPAAAQEAVTWAPWEQLTDSNNDLYWRREGSDAGDPNIIYIQYADGQTESELVLTFEYQNTSKDGSLTESLGTYYREDGVTVRETQRYLYADGQNIKLIVITYRENGILESTHEAEYGENETPTLIINYSYDENGIIRSASITDYDENWEVEKVTNASLKQNNDSGFKTQIEMIDSTDKKSTMLFEYDKEGNLISAEMLDTASNKWKKIADPEIVDPIRAILLENAQ